MTNEELAVEIRNGRKDLQIELWEQVRKFITVQAKEFLLSTPYRGNTIEDLEQSGFLAMIDAVQSFDPERGNFIHYLSFFLKRHFRKAAFLETRRQAKDPINTRISLDKVVQDEDKEYTLSDMVPDPCNRIERLEHDLYRQQLLAAIETEINNMTEIESYVLRSFYLQDKTHEEIAESLGSDPNTVSSIKKRGLDKLRKSRRLIAFLNEGTPFYCSVRYGSFLRDHNSATEKAVFKRMELEQKYRRLLKNKE